MRKILILGLCRNFRILDQNGLVSFVSGCILRLTSSYYKNSVVVSILGKGKYFTAAVLQLQLIKMKSRDVFVKTKKNKAKIVEKRKYHEYK